MAGTKMRPGVILRVRDDGRPVVIYGTSTRRETLRCVQVEPRQAAGLALGLKNTTYFYANAIVVPMQPAAFTLLEYLCPPTVFLDLRELVGDVRRDPSF
jgi:hypothetical protein